MRVRMSMYSDRYGDGVGSCSLVVLMRVARSGSGRVLPPHLTPRLG